jgi:multidrug efflux pump subunit AcrA (membrane-fusion protein)
MLLGFRRRPKSQRMLRAALPLMVAGSVLAGCQEVPSNLVESQPYKVTPIEGTDLNRVELADEIAEKIDLQTDQVRGNGKQKIVPHTALIYNPDGEVFVYTNPAPETYIRAPVKVSRAIDDRVVLDDGPPTDTVIVTVGAAELLATEYEILNQHP